MHTDHPLLSFAPLSIKHHTYKPGFRSKPFITGRSSICCVQNGSGCLFINEQPYPLKAGAIFLLEPAMKIQIMNDSDNLIRIHLIHYKCVRLATNELNFAGDPDHSPLYDEEQLVRYASAAVTETLVIQLHQAFKEQSMLSHIKKQQLFCELLLHMHVPLKTNKQTVNESVQQTIAYMEEKFAKAIQMSDLPIMAGMTPSSYCRAFKKMTGLTPGHYLTRLRMMRAKELMSEPSAALRDVATSIGYQDELYFSRVFKKTEGISPSVYLKRRDRKIAVVSSYFLQDHLLALGILPIAAPSYPKYFTTPSGFPTYLHDRLSGTIPLNAERTIMTSDVMRLSPDMILKTEFQKNPNDQLWNANKNTIFIDPSTTWEHYLRSIAVRVQKEREAERIIRQMTLLEQETRKKLSHATKHGKWVIIRLLPNNCRLYGIKDHTFTELFYRRLQFKNDERITHSVYIDHALEQLFDLDPENILIIWSEETEVNELAGNERWQNLRAVKENRVYYPDSREWDPWGPIGREYMIRAMTRYFAKTGLTSSAMDQPDWQRSRSMV